VKTIPFVTVNFAFLKLCDRHPGVGNSRRMSRNDSETSGTRDHSCATERCRPLFLIIVFVDISIGFRPTQRSGSVRLVRRLASRTQGAPHLIHTESKPIRNHSGLLLTTTIDGRIRTSQPVKSWDRRPFPIGLHESEHY
jgi:hypothetical protein